MSEPEVNKPAAENPGPAETLSINLGLDEYDDIFSDFDARPYAQRMLSEDFLHELKRASLGQGDEGVVLNLLLPQARRNPATEKVVRDRLKSHFRRRHLRLEEKHRKDITIGVLMVALGIVCMLVATYLLTGFPQNLWRSFIVVLLEPAGWFTFWEGLSQLLFYSKDTQPNLVFYRKMSGAKIGFVSVG
jgi:hypothetical protein